MRVCFFFTERFEKAIAALPVEGVEFVYTSREIDSYWKALSARWNTGEDLVTIEQDNVIHDQVIPEFSECSQDWCSFPYFAGVMIGNWNHTGPLSMVNFLNEGLGCTKFSAELQREVSVSDIMDQAQKYTSQCDHCFPDCGYVCHCHIDGPLKDAIEAKGFSVHVHQPFIDHLHYQPREA